jgi:hypothetical protein
VPASSSSRVPRAAARRGELVELGERRGARHRVAAERAAEPARVHGVHQLGAAGDAGERQPAAERLPGDEQVGLDPVVLDRPHGSGAAATRLHLVVDVDDAVSLAKVLQRPQELGRHRDEAAFALHGLDHEAGDLARIDVLLEQKLEAVQRVGGRDAAIGVGGGRPVDVGGEGPEALLVDELRGHRHREVRAAVERAVEDDDARPAGRGARDLDRVLDRLGARVQEQGLRGGAARPELVELLGDGDIRLVDADHEALVEVAVDLLVDRPHDARVAVAEILAGDPSGEVDVLAALGVPDAGAPGAADDEVARGDPPRDEPLSVAKHLCGGRLFLDPHRNGVSRLPQCEANRLGYLRNAQTI